MKQLFDSSPILWVFSFFSQGQAEEDKDQSLTDPDLTHSLPQVGKKK